MLLAGYFLRAVAQLLHGVIWIFIYILFFRAILSWVNPDPNNGIVQFLYSSTEPILSWVKRYIKPMGMFDLSVIVVLFALYFLDSFLVGSLGAYAELMIYKAVPAGM